MVAKILKLRLFLTFYCFYRYNIRRLGNRIENDNYLTSFQLPLYHCNILLQSAGCIASIGTGTVVEDSSVENSVILEDCRVLKIGRLADSVIGRNVSIVKREPDSEAIVLFLGDDARLEL